MRTRRSNRPSILWLIVLGAVIGVGWYAFNSRLPEPAQTVLLPTTTPPLPTPESLVSLPEIASTARPMDVTRISIAELGVFSDIVHLSLQDGSWDVSTLGRNVGYLRHTAWFDSPGNIVLVGHVELRDGGLGPFSQLERATPGMEVRVEYQGEMRYYRIEQSRRVTPDDVSVLHPTRQEQLTLITCSDYDFFSNTYNERVVVTALRVG